MYNELENSRYKNVQPSISWCFIFMCHVYDLLAGMHAILYISKKI
jgi:hypothetical protein